MKKSCKTPIRETELHPKAVKAGESFYAKGDGETWSLWVRATKEGKIKGAGLMLLIVI